MCLFVFVFTFGKLSSSPRTLGEAGSVRAGLGKY